MYRVRQDGQGHYKDSLGHAYQSVVVREATCETPGKTMDICERCGNVKESTIPQTEHEYETQVLPATCTSPGYTLNECVVCGDRHITDLTPALSHTMPPRPSRQTVRPGARPSTPALAAVPPS